MQTLREKMITIAEQYCEMHNIKREDLFQTGSHKGAKKRRVVNGVSVATIRMALGYYLSNHFPASLTEVASIIGYNDHSTLSYNNKKIYFYIKNNDAYFMRFYSQLLELGKLYEPVKFDRISRNQFALLK